MNKSSGYSKGVWQTDSKIHTEEKNVHKLPSMLAHTRNPSMRKEDHHEIKSSLKLLFEKQTSKQRKPVNKHVQRVKICQQNTKTSSSDNLYEDFLKC